MNKIEDVEFVEQKDFNVLQLTGYENALVGITHEAKPRAIYSLSKVIDLIKTRKKIDRNGAFKEFELEVRMPLFEQSNAPIYLNDL